MRAAELEGSFPAQSDIPTPNPPGLSYRSGDGSRTGELP